MPTTTSPLGLRCALATLAASAGLATSGAAAPAAAPPGHPSLLVTESGGFAQAASDRPVIALYPDGRAVIGERQGRVGGRAVADLLARHAEAASAPPPSAPPCATDLPTAEITIRPADADGRSVALYGLGVCEPDSPFSHLVADARALTFIRQRLDPAPTVAQVVLADGAPGPAEPWRGATLRPGGWVRVEDSAPRLVRQAGHRFALLPRVLLPHERRRGAGPGDAIVRVATAPRVPGPLGLRAPAVLVRGDGSWSARDGEGRWLAGDLTPAEIDGVARVADAAGAGSLAPLYRQVRGPVTTLSLVWGARLLVRASGLGSGLASGIYPPALGAVRDALLGIRPAVTRPLAPAAVRLAWRPRARPAPRSSPSLASAVRLSDGPGQRIVVGVSAERLWTATGQRSYRGAASVGRRGYLVAVEPLLG